MFSNEELKICKQGVPLHYLMLFPRLKKNFGVWGSLTPPFYANVETMFSIQIPMSEMVKQNIYLTCAVSRITGTVIFNFVLLLENSLFSDNVDFVNSLDCMNKEIM